MNMIFTATKLTSTKNIYGISPLDDSILISKCYSSVEEISRNTEYQMNNAMVSMYCISSTIWRINKYRYAISCENGGQIIDWILFIYCDEETIFTIPISIVDARLNEYYKSKLRTMIRNILAIDGFMKRHHDSPIYLSKFALLWSVSYWK